jgi:hypothetical protein
MPGVAISAAVSGRLLWIRWGRWFLLVTFLCSGKEK